MKDRLRTSTDILFLLDISLLSQSNDSWSSTSTWHTDSSTARCRISLGTWSTFSENGISFLWSLQNRPTRLFSYVNNRCAVSNKIKTSTRKNSIWPYAMLRTRKKPMINFSILISNVHWGDETTLILALLDHRLRITIWTTVADRPMQTLATIQIDMLTPMCIRIPPVILSTLTLIEWIVTMLVTRVIHRIMIIPIVDRGTAMTMPMIAIEKRNPPWKTSKDPNEKSMLSFDFLSSRSTSRREDSAPFKRNSSQQQYTSGSHHANNDYAPPHNNRRGDDWNDPWDR